MPKTAKKETAPLPENIEDIESLTALWRAAKNSEDQAKEERIAIEAMILSHPDAIAGRDKKKNSHGDAKGTIKVGESTTLSITFALDGKYDQNHVASVLAKYPEEEWPFKIEYKPVAAGLKWAAESRHEMYEELQDGFSTKPKKPAFKYVPPTE